MPFDFSTLPKVRTYGYMGGLGKLGACTWYTPWDCYTPAAIQQAKAELEDAHVGVIDFARATKAFYDDAVSGGAPGSIVSALGDDVSRSQQLVRDHTALMNKFYAETGAGVAGLSGGGLGWVATLPVLAELLGTALRWAGFGVLLYQLGDVLKSAASAFQTNFKANQEKFQRDGQYYMAWKQAKETGQEPPPAPDDSGVTDWTTIALIGGSVVLAIMLLAKK